MTQEQLKAQAIFRITVFFLIMITIGIYASSIQAGLY
jgi:hypothetical protein